MATAYAEWSPSQFDTRGLGCDEQQDWLVGPCTLNRDSEALSTANWRAMLAILDAKGLEYETKSFGHWACGWIEICLVAPTEAAIAELESIEDALSDYPILDESLFSELETEEENAAWESYGAREFADALRTEFDLSECTHDWLCAFSGDLASLFHEYDCGGSPDELSARIERASQSTRLTRVKLAAWIRETRLQAKLDAAFEGCRDAFIEALAARYSLRGASARLLAKRPSHSLLSLLERLQHAGPKAQRGKARLLRMLRSGFMPTVVLAAKFDRLAFASELASERRCQRYADKVTS